MGSKESFFRSKYIHARTMKLYASANRKGKRQMKKFSFFFLYTFLSQHNPKYELLCMLLKKWRRSYVCMMRKKNEMKNKANIA